MKRIPFREIMADLLVDRDLNIENEPQRSLRIRLQRLFRWATTTTHGEAAIEVADILEGREARKFWRKAAKRKKKAQK